jgi:DNA-directed RNA polymerase subunit H (RpoH/RPB5)
LETCRSPKERLIFLVDSLNRKYLADIVVRKLELRKGDCVQFFRDKQTGGVLIVKVRGDRK